MIARVGRGLHRLAPLLHPLHGAAELARQQAQRDLLGIEDGLHAEAAADVGRDHAHAALGQLEELGQQMAREMRHLRARPQRQLVLGGVPVGDAAAALEGRRALAVGAERARDHRRRPGQGGVHVTGVEAAREEEIAGGRLVHQRRALAGGGEHIDDGRPGIVVHAEPGGGVFGGVAIGGDHGRDRLAHVAHERPRQQRRARADAVAGHELVAAGGDGRHALGAQRRAGVDPGETRVSVDAAHERHVQQARQLDVAHVAPAPGEQARVLPPAHRGAERRRRLEGLRHQTIA